jgi:glucokinase
MRHPPVVLGLDYGGTKIAAAACDLAGNRLASATMDSGSESGAQASFDRGIAAGRELLSAAAPDSILAAVGVSTFGIPFEDRVELAPAISGWDSLAMGRELRSAFPAAEIRMATDAKAAAGAEARWGALADCDPAVFLNLGTGLAAAIVVGGRVVNGRDGAAGEIGYSLRAISDAGLPLRQRTPLEDMVSGQALARRGTELAAPGGQLTAADVFAPGRGDGELAKLVDEFVDELAFHLVNLAICLNPARIAVGGGLVRSWDRIGPGLQRALSNGVPFPPELVVARFPYDAPLLGAVAMAVDAANAPARARAHPPDPAARDGAHLPGPAADGRPVTLSQGRPA